MPNPTTPNPAPALVRAARDLTRALAPLEFSPPVVCVYNPLEYAWPAHRAYLQTYARNTKRILFLGMNPGPFGMVQTGVPFGEVNAVRDWMGLQASVGKPRPEHPRRPVQGFACARSEVSGRRLWSLFAKRFPHAPDFFRTHFVANYCPLAFLEASGRNRTPGQLPRPQLAPVTKACDRHLCEIVRLLEPRFIIGVGNFATRQAARLFEHTSIRLGTIPHPSPANPAANRNWPALAAAALVNLGAWDPD